MFTTKLSVKMIVLSIENSNIASYLNLPSSVKLDSCQRCNCKL